MNVSPSSTFLRLYVLRTFWHTSAICVVYSNLKESFRPKNGIKSWDEAPSRTSTYRWYGEFNRGSSSLQGEFREDRLKLVVVPETIDVVRQLIFQDRHVTYREIETTLGISGTIIHSILHEHLTVKKICSRWIPHNL